MKDTKLIAMSAVVIELGNTALRYGLAGEACPRAIISLDPLPSIQHCYAYMLKLFSHLFLDCLGLKPRDSRVLIIESLLETKLLRDIIISVLFTDLQVALLQSSKL